MRNAYIVLGKLKILGGKGFKAKIMRLLDKIKADEEILQIRRLKGAMPVDRIINACCSFYDKKEDDLIKRGKGKWERQIAIYLSKILSGKKNKEVGNFFNIRGPAVSGVIKAVEERLDKEKRLKKEIEHLKEMIINNK